MGGTLSRDIVMAARCRRSVSVAVGLTCLRLSLRGRPGLSLRTRSVGPRGTFQDGGLSPARQDGRGPAAVLLVGKARDDTNPQNLLRETTYPAIMIEGNQGREKQIAVYIHRYVMDPPGHYSKTPLLRRARERDRRALAIAAHEPHHQRAGVRQQRAIAADLAREHVVDHDRREWRRTGRARSRAALPRCPARPPRDWWCARSKCR